MKITFVMPVVHQNGGSRVVAIHARNLLALGHDVTVVSRAPEKLSPGRRLIHTLRHSFKRSRSDPERTVYFDPLGGRHVQIPWKWPLDAEDVPDADVVIATWWRTAFEVSALPSEKGAKVYFVQHHEIHDRQPRDLAAGSYHLPLRKVAVSQWLVEVMTETYSARDVAKVPNAVDIGQFDTPPRDRGSHPQVGMMYAGTPFKGFDTGLTAIRMAAERVPGIKLVAFGRNLPPAGYLPEGAEFHLLPSQTDLPQIYASCDVWLMPSRSEGFGLPLLEAMACRTPVVATRTGAAVDVIDEGINGHVVAVENAAEMGARIADILTLSSEDWRAMSAAAHARVQTYGWDEASAALEQVLSESVSGS